MSRLSMYFFFDHFVRFALLWWNWLILELALQRKKPHQHDQLEEWYTVTNLYYTVPYRIWIWNRKFCIRKYKYSVQCNSYVEPRIYDTNTPKLTIESIIFCFFFACENHSERASDKPVNEEFWQSFLSWMRQIKKFFDTETVVLFSYRQSIHSDLETRLLRQSLTLDHT